MPSAKGISNCGRAAHTGPLRRQPGAGERKAGNALEGGGRVEGDVASLGDPILSSGGEGVRKRRTKRRGQQEQGFGVGCLEGPASVLHWGIVG